MGATGSIVSGREYNIEMNIADEAPSDNLRSMRRHNSQPAGSIFNQLKLRQKNLDGNVRQSTSLRSSGSFDPTSSPMMLLNVDQPNLRHDYETQKVTLEQEIQNLKRKEQKLDTENNRLRAELQAVNKQCQKLRSERDAALESSSEATERATALQQDREKIQRQFKIFRETKESEIQTLLQAKRQLESNLYRLEASGMAMIDDPNFALPDANPLTSSAAPHGEWWATPESEVTSLFGSCAQLRAGFSESSEMPDAAQDSRVDLTASLPNEAWMTSSNNLSSILPVANAFEAYGKNILRCYVAATPDCIEDAKELLQHRQLIQLQHICSKEGHFLSTIHFSGSSDYATPHSNESPVPGQEDCIEFAIAQSTLFIAFVGQHVGKYTELECSEGHFNRPGQKSSFFCVKGAKDESSGGGGIRTRVVSNAGKRYATYRAVDDGCDIALKEIVKAVRLTFGIKIAITSSSVEVCESDEVTCIDEMPTDEQMEQTQQELALTGNTRLQPVGFEKCYDRLDEVVTSPGPVPPLLVSGTSGSGKTLLLSSWTERLRSRRPDVIVLQHFVSGTESLDAEPVVVLRRLLTQLLRHLPATTLPPLRSYATHDIATLRDTLPRWLEQLSARLNHRIVLVIDALDRVKDAQVHFQWLLDPLQVGVRVVISVTVDCCPEVWRQWPPLHMEPLTAKSVKTLIQNCAEESAVRLPPQWENDITKQCRTSTTYHPLFVTLLCALACSVCKNELPDTCFFAALRSRDTIELYRSILRDVEAASDNREHKNLLKTILQFIACSRDGLSETELMSMFPDLTWSKWIPHVRRLLSLRVLKEEAGIYRPHNSEIGAIMFDQFVGNEAHQRRCWQKMALETRRCHGDRAVTPRGVNLLPWILRKLEDRDRLLEVVSSPALLHIVYSRGRTGELVSMLNYLNEDKLVTSRRYSDAIRKQEGSGDVSDATEVAQMLTSLGRFVAELGLMDEAVSALQRSMEIRETVLDPDHPAVADSLHHLASVYAQWNKPATAEPLFRHALELVECAAGRDHPRVAQEISSLIRLARKSGSSHDQTDVLMQRVVKIKRKNGPATTTSGLERLRKRALSLEELTVGEDSLEMAKALNDLGVVYHMQNNFDGFHSRLLLLMLTGRDSPRSNAESFFVRSLKMREKLLGESHRDVAQSCYNLALVHGEQKRYDSAISSMTKALHIRKSDGSGCHDNQIVAAMKGLALLYKKSKDRLRAAKLYADILQFHKQTSGDSSPATANAMLNLAVCESQNKNLDVALPLYKKALEIYQATFGSKSQQALQTLRNIAVLLYQQGDHEEAALAYKQSLGGSTTSPQW